MSIATSEAASTGEHPTAGMVELHKCCEPIRGITFGSSDAKAEPFEGSVCCLTTGAVQSELDWSSGRYIPDRLVRDKRQFLQVGDLLVSTANSKALVGKLSIVRSLPHHATFGAFVTVLRPFGHVSADYLFHCLRSDRARRYFYEKSSETTNISNLRTEEMLAFTVPLPPQESQERIAQRLSQQLAAIERARVAARERLAAAEALPAAYLREVFEGSAARGENAWPRSVVGKVCQLVNGDTYKESDWSVTGTRIIRIQNLNNHKKPFNHWAGPTDDLVRVKSGDVLLAWSGTPGTSFGAHLWERGDGVLNQHIFRVDLDRVLCDPRWFVHAVNHALDELIDAASGAVGLCHVTKGEVQALEIPLPLPVEQERQMVRLSSRLTEAERLSASLHAELNAIDGLSAALLRQAFDMPTAVGAISGQDLIERGTTPTRSTIPFRRGAVASYIVHRLHARPVFGRVHFEKNLFLTETHVGIDLAGRYERKAAGPLDADTLKEIETLAADHRWFTRHPRGDKGYTYHPGAEIAGPVHAAAEIFGDDKARMDAMLDLTAQMDTEKIEIVATLFAAWNDRLIGRATVRDDLIVEDVREYWHVSKQRFTPERLAIVLNEMRSVGFIPRGIGPATRSVNDEPRPKQQVLPLGGVQR